MKRNLESRDSMVEIFKDLAEERWEKENVSEVMYDKRGNDRRFVKRLEIAEEMLMHVER